MSNRHCGPCQLCCHVLTVEPLNKPQNTRCKHQCARGCGIYDQRPNACRAFSCAWLKMPERMPKRFRPDRVGAVVWATSLLSSLGKERKIGILEVTQDTRRKVDEKFRQYTIDNFSHRVPLSWVVGRWSTIYQDGEKLVHWHKDREMIRLDIDHQGKLHNVRRVPMEEAFPTPESRAAWERMQAESMEVLEG